MGFLKTDGSVSTLALSEDMSQNDLNSLELTKQGGTPLLKIWSCCLPQSSHEEIAQSLPRSEEKIYSPPPVVVAEIENCQEVDDPPLDTPGESKEIEIEEPVPLLDNGLLWQVAILSGFLVGQACNLI